MFNPISFLAVVQTIITVVIIFIPKETLETSSTVRFFSKMTDYGTPITVGVLSFANEQGNVFVHAAFWVAIVCGWVCPYFKDKFPMWIKVAAFLSVLAYPWIILLFPN